MGFAALSTSSASRTVKWLSALVAASSLTACASVREPYPFNRIKLGMSEAAVIRALGPAHYPCPDLPLGGYHCAAWVFANPRGGSPHIRSLAFDPDNRLFDIAGDGIDCGFTPPPGFLEMMDASSERLPEIRPDGELPDA